MQVNFLGGPQNSSTNKIFKLIHVQSENVSNDFKEPVMDPCPSLLL